MNDDPFHYHPGLRGLILDPDQSDMRDISLDSIVALSPDPNIRDLLTPDDVREAGRRELLADRKGQDLWIFAYGSLMWDPAIRFKQVRHAFAPGYQRRFILKDTRGPRGNAERPGVMAALDKGKGCHGLAFLIDRDLVEEETYRLWSRERIGPAYFERMIPLELSDARVEAVAFVANHEAPFIVPDLSREEQVEYAATGSGFRGTSFEYVENLVLHFRELGVEDAELTDFYDAVCARRARQ